MYLNETFNALLNEAKFTKEMLGAGATQIRFASFLRKGVYFQAFTSLSTGLERIGKLCLLLDYYVDHSGEFPDQHYLRKGIGHDIVLLHTESLRLVEKYSLSFKFTDTSDEDIQQAILTILSKFAKGDRYANLNLLLNDKWKGDPMESWYRLVDQPLFKTYVSEDEKDRILFYSALALRMFGPNSIVLYSSESGSEVSDINDASYRAGMQEAVAPFRQLYVLRIIRFWVELLNGLHYAARALGKEEIPHLPEVFAPFFNSDEFLRNTEAWDIF